MIFRRFLYGIKEGTRNIFRNKMFSLASLGTIIACVFLLGTFLSVALNVRSTMQQMEQSVGISVFFEPGISTERKDQIGEEIKKKEDIATMRYVSAEEAWESYKKDVFQGNEELLEGFEGNNPLKESDSYEITFKEVKSYKQVVSHLETIDGVRKVRYSEGAAASQNARSYVQTIDHRALRICKKRIQKVLMLSSFFLINSSSYLLSDSYNETLFKSLHIVYVKWYWLISFRFVDRRSMESITTDLLRCFGV